MELKVLNREKGRDILEKLQSHDFRVLEDERYNVGKECKNYFFVRP